MKRVLSTAAAIMVVGAICTPAVAEDRPTPIAPPKTMGDEGKLPPTEKGAAPKWVQQILLKLAHRREWAIKARCPQRRDERCHTANEPACRAPAPAENNMCDDLAARRGRQISSTCKLALTARRQVGAPS